MKDKVKIFFKKISDDIEKTEVNDLHSIMLVMVDCARWGRFFRILEKEDRIIAYFEDNPDIYDHVKELTTLINC